MFRKSFNSSRTKHFKANLQQVTNFCTNGINENPGLKPIIQAGVFDPTNAIHNCIQDILVCKKIGKVMYGGSK